MINNVEQKVGRDEGLRKLARIALPVIKSAVLRRLAAVMVRTDAITSMPDTSVAR
jgi:hypothetical protein